MWNISYEKPTHGLFKDRTGEVFGRLRIVSFNHIKRKYNASIPYWKCICECGNETIVDSSALVSEATTSCGCFQKEKVREANTKHGLSENLVYNRARNEIYRCCNPDFAQYEYYGGRGITVYEPWRNNFELMTREIIELIGLPPTEYHQLDRTDVNRGLEPDNIRWVTPEENSRNKRNTHNQSVDPVTRKRTPTYNSWLYLIYHHKDEVCIEWVNDWNSDTDNGFKNFYRDMGEKPRKRSPIKRHDESKPFCKSNCYWG